MGKKSKTSGGSRIASQSGGGSKISPQTRATRPVPNWPLLGLSSLGILLTGYLSWAAFSGGAVEGCSAGQGCDVVLNSPWATLLGLPTAFWGLLGYTGLAAIAFIRWAEKQWSYAWTAAFFGVCYSVYLTVVSLSVLEAACPYCLTSLGLMSATLAFLALQRPPKAARRSWMSLVAGRGAIAAVAVLTLHVSYLAPQAEPVGPEDPDLRALAEHLADKGAIFYGTSWCPHCQEQKRRFGASASRLPYVECSPGGQRSPQAKACSDAGVKAYPTWVINGNTIHGRTLSLAELADASGFPGAANFKANASLAP